MRNILFLLVSILLNSCGKDETITPKTYPGEPVSYTVIPEYSVKAHLASDNKVSGNRSHPLSMKDSIIGNSAGWYNGTYTAQDTVKLHIKVHCWFTSTSAGFAYFIKKNNVYVRSNDVYNNHNFSGSRDVEAWEVIMYPGDKINIGFGNSQGETGTFVNGSNWNNPTDYSYTLIEAYQ